MNRPPFTSSATPFTYDASSDARNAIAAAPLPAAPHPAQGYVSNG